VAHEIAVVPFGQVVPWSCSTNACDPCTPALVQQPSITPELLTGPDAMAAPAVPAPASASGRHGNGSKSCFRDHRKIPLSHGPAPIVCCEVASGAGVMRQMAWRWRRT
jgi:hypothetical protein